MRLHPLYYTLKPYLPARLRVAVRRQWARRRRHAYAGVWPIDPAAAVRPRGWVGWPAGKQFAFVLTHDVESARGLARVEAVATLETESGGFHSSFNFIPEGSYRVTTSQRVRLDEQGFEVGVHDLQHDGKLFRSASSFRFKAKRINRYLQEWGAQGFRSAFMLRELDWLHELDLLYDSSTFDTDPFEPQPTAAGTIYPYWVDAGSAQRTPGQHPRPAGGYVELPYTLPQDSTLFLILGEDSPAIWLKKLDWIAEHGGLALVNVHPDYLRFPGQRPAADQYPSSHYTTLLQHVARRYKGKYWNPLPRELAEWFRASRRSSTAGASAGGISIRQPLANTVADMKGRRAAVLLYSHYLSDPRPRRAAEALAESGFRVDVICLRESDREPRNEVVSGVCIHRLPISHRRGGRFVYLWQYGAFVCLSFFLLTRRELRRSYDLVHVHNMPDFLVFSAIVPKLRGARIVLDLHDPMPELMMTIFGASPDSLLVKGLRWLERRCISLSDQTITVNKACRRIFAQRSGQPAKIHVVMNAPDERIFPSVQTKDFPPVVRSADARFVIMYHGSLVERHGLDLAVRALQRVLSSVPGAELHVYGRHTPFLDHALAEARELGVSSAVHYFGAVRIEEIATAIRGCDVGVIPNRRSLFTEINTPTRIFEYLSQGKPVVVPRSEGILDYFGPEDLFYFPLGDADELAEQLLNVFYLPYLAARTVQRGQEVYRKHGWTRERARFLRIIAGSLGLRSAPAGEAPRPLAAEELEVRP